MGELTVFVLFWAFVVIPLALLVAAVFTVCLIGDWLYTSTRGLFKNGGR